MNRKDKEILLKILSHTENVLTFCSGIENQKVFESDEMVMTA